MNNNFSQAMLTKDTYTDNGALTHSTSSDACLDMFFLAGASRNISETNIVNLWVKSYEENPELATLVLLWARDAREGAGERRFFSIISKYILSKDKYENLVPVIKNAIPKLGYWKDYFNIFPETSENVNYLKYYIYNDNLLSKWYPRKGYYFNKMFSLLGMTPKDFRKFLVSKSNTVEQKMCSNEWGQIEFGQVPSIAHNKYKKAFARHQQERYTKYLNRVEKGEETINSSVIYPYQLIDGISNNDKTSILQWNNLPDFMSEDSGTILPVVDVSGSMETFLGKTKYTALDISISLGLYLSERNKSSFKDMFITFSENPELQVLKGDINERFKQLRKSHWGYNTDLVKVFKTILKRAVNYKLTQEDMPETVLIISDMEFDSACKSNTRTNYEQIEREYAIHGYVIPKLVFWNVMGKVGNVPVKTKTPNTALVSGFSPSIVKSIFSGKDFTPETIMLETVFKYKPYLMV